jgi:tetraacyldisaccharide 4'-kinase
MNTLRSLILPPLGAIYGGVTRARLAAYRRGWLSVSKLPVPVISVGNLTTGGTGKTPLVEWVCHAIAGGRELAGDRENNPQPETRKRICVLTRGYGRPDGQSQVVVSDGKQLLASVDKSGDEPYLLAKNLMGIAAVVCNPNRYAAGEWAIRNLGSEVFVLDDGFQHLELARNLDIVAIDATNPWGNGKLLPYGRLREPRRGLSRAHCAVITRTDQAERVADIQQIVSQFLGSGNVFLSRMVTTGLLSLDGKTVDRESLRASPVAAFCGVGNPRSFFTQLKNEGFQITLTRAFADHHHYSQTDINHLLTDATSNGAQLLLTTAKDATKLAGLEIKLPCYVLDVQIEIADDGRLVELLQNACDGKSAAR